MIKGITIQEQEPTPDKPEKIISFMVDEEGERYIKRLQNEIERLNNIINELEKELDRGYLDLFEHELVPGRELITNIKNYLQELKGSVSNE